MTTVKNVSSQKKVMTHPGIATNTMTLHHPVFGMFDNSIIFLDGIELVKFNGQQYKGGSES